MRMPWLCCLTTHVCPSMELQYPLNLDTHHQQFLEAVNYDEITAVERLLKTHRIDVTVHAFAVEDRHGEVMVKSKFNAVHIAAINDNIRLMKLILEHSTLSDHEKCELINTGADKNNSKTPLHFAVENNNLNMVKFLVENGADINKESVLYSTVVDVNGTKSIISLEYDRVLRMATSYEMRKLLLEYGADPNRVPTDSSKRHMLLPLQQFGARNDTKAIQLLLKHKADVNLRTDRTALQVACKHLNLNAIQVLLEHHADILVLDKYGSNCLDCVLMNFETKTKIFKKKHVILAVNMLLKAAKRLDITDDILQLGKQNSVISRFITEGLNNNSIDLCQILIKAASVEALRRNKSILRKACRFASYCLSRLKFFNFIFSLYEPELSCSDSEMLSGILLDILTLRFGDEKAIAEVMNTLLRKGANANYFDHRSKFTLLHHAAGKGYVRVIKTLRSYGACINSRGWDGSTPLHFAVSGNYCEVVQELLSVDDQSERADTRYETNERKTALHVALQNGHTAIVKHLVKSQSVRITADISALKFAVESGCVRTIKYFSKVHELSDNSIVIRPLGWTVLHELAAKKPQEKTVKEAFLFLLTKVEDIDVTTLEGATALHVACSKGNVELSEILVQHNANLNAVTTYGWNVFHFAVLSGNVNMLKWLLALTYLPKSSGFLDVSHLHIAVFCNLLGMCSELIANGIEVDQESLSYARFFQHGEIEAILLHKQETRMEPKNTQTKALIQTSYAQIENERKSTGACLTAMQEETLFTPCKYHTKMESAIQQFGKSQIENFDFDQIVSGLNLLQKHRIIRRLAHVLHIPEVYCVDVKCSCIPISEETRNNFCVSLLTKPGLGKLPDIEEVSMIKEAVKGYVESLCHKVKDIDKRFEISVEGAGSSFENCKIGHPDEFDFMCCLVKFHGKISEKDVREFSEVNQNFKKLILKEEIRKDYEEFCDASGYLNSSDVNFHFYCLIEEALNKAELPENLHSGNSGLSPRTKENGIYPAGAKLTLLWTGKHYAALNIEVDLTPAIFLDNSLKGLNIKVKDVLKGYHVIAKPLASKDLSRSILEECHCWRVSLSALETKLISVYCSEYQRDVFMLAKILRRQVCRPRQLSDCSYTAEEAISSYLLKNVFLKMVFNGEIDQARENLGVIVIKLYMNLLDTIQLSSDKDFRRYIPGSFFMPDCELLPGKRKGDSRKATLTYEPIDQRNLILKFIVTDILEGVLGYEYPDDFDGNARRGTR